MKFTTLLHILQIQAIHESDQVSKIFFLRSYSKLPDTIFKLFTASPFGKCKRVRWSSLEKRLVKETFKDCFKNKTLPSFERISKLIEDNPGVFNRNLASIKTWVKNENKKKQNDMDDD